MKRVLYIEDNETNAILMQHVVLNCEDVELVVAETGEKGLDLIEHEHFDLLLLDIELPGISGIEVLRRLNGTSHPPVIVVSASGMPTELREIQSLGVEEAWTKPLDLRFVLNRLSQVLGTPCRTL